MESVRDNLVALVKEHPAGIPLKKLLQHYQQKYHQNLTFSTLGFDSMKSLIASLDSELVIVGQNVMHKDHLCNNKLSTPSSVLPDPEFPTLQDAVRLTKGSKDKHRDVSLNGSSTVFRDAYHAQLRETHGANMRAVEAAEEDFTGHRGRRNRFLDPNTVNNLMEDVMRQIAEDGELVTKEKVVSKVCQQMQIQSLEAGGIHPGMTPALKDLQYKIREVNMFIECVESASSICTLYEVGCALAGLKDKKHYEELNLGPLCKLPRIHRVFKIDSNTKDDDIQQIETVDILKLLNNFRKKSRGRVDLTEFMQHLADHYNCDSPYKLGIRINSIALPIATLSKVFRQETVIYESARRVIQGELEEETYERLRKVKKRILEPVQGVGPSFPTGNLELRRKYASMSAAELVLTVFNNAKEVFSEKMAWIETFLLQVSGNQLANALFQLAICGGSLALPHNLVPKETAPKTSKQTNREDQAHAPLPSEAKLKQFIKDSLSSQSSTFTLAHMTSLEKKLIKHFQVKDFLSLEKGTFLEFLVKHIQLLQDMLGSVVFLATADGGFRPTRQDVFEFIKQCSSRTLTDPDELGLIESALRCHYRLRDSRDLGYGALHMLAGLVQRQRSLPGAGSCPVYYEAALFSKHSQPRAEGGCEAVGRLGETSKFQALTCLLSCPLLVDLSEWSQWDLIFKPSHGSLKEFIQRNAANTGLAALEVTPGRLLKITSYTGDKHFSRAAVNLDPVGTAGHLVSMVVADGVANTPTALLANHVQSSLASAIAKEDVSLAEDSVSCYSKAAKFLLECWTRIPTRICQAVLQQVFLEPFSLVLGQCKSKRVLMDVAQSDAGHLNCLHRLGIVLGITDWVKDYQRKLDPAQSTHTAPAEQARSNLTDSQSSSLSALNTSDDLEEDILDSRFASPQQDTSSPQANGEGDCEVKEGEDGEDLYELLPNGEASDVSSEAEGESDTPGCDDSDAASGQTEGTPHQRAIIEDIRRNEFGIGVELSAESQKLMQVQQERLGRSLDRLSTELYSKDTHFVLELIQNADDNTYPSEAGAIPALAFVVENDCITILNNEMGFQEKNVRAICDVGRSTKGKHKYGYIGQKGIGFKSVFKVTDCPEIHSNGFHLHFDKTSGPMGYILPHWAEADRPLDSQLEAITQHSWTTKIRLPLRSQSRQTRNLFHDVHPSLLLFLHRLRAITIYNQSEQRLVKMTRKDLTDNILEVEHTDGTERWLVVKTTLHPRKIKEDVESTELALAFQLTGSGESEIVPQPQKQPVFAFLPLRSFGFRFIVQGDFDIPSSREDVDRDSPWNQWLRSEIPQLFLQAMENYPEFSGVKGLHRFLHFIPLPDEVLDFFRPVAGQIIQLLKGKAFLPTLNAGGRVVYKQPSEVAVCQDAVIREVIGGDELERHLSLSYLHPSLSSAPLTSLLTHLGVRYLRGSDVSMVTTAMARELTRTEGIHTDGGLRRLARLLVCNFRALEHGYGESESVLQALRALPIIPLADGRVVALAEEGVFLPVETQAKKSRDLIQTGSLAALYKDINVVEPALLSCLEPLESQQVLKLLRMLGVHELEPQQLLDEHIYPTIQSSKWKLKPEPVVVSYLVFIKNHSRSIQDCVHAAVPVLTNKGLRCPAEEKVHFSVDYDNMDLSKRLPGHDWIMLSSCYVETDGDVSGWKELLSRLGVRDGLIIRRERVALAAEELAASPWSAESRSWNLAPAQGCELDDYPCEEFRALATAQLQGSAPDLLQQRLTLLELLANNWDTGHRYSQYLRAQVVDGDGREVKSTKSSFYHDLCSLEWVPAFRPLEGEQQERMYLRPTSVYLSSPEVSSLLGTHVCYADLTPSDFTRTIGMRHNISVEAMINYLKEWCIRPADKQELGRHGEDLEGADFTSTVQHIYNVYNYLYQNCSKGILKELFQHNPAVFIEYSRRDGNWCSGHFYHLKEVCWSDPTAMFLRYKRLTHATDGSFQEPKVLAPFYNPLEGMRDFFLNLLKADRSPNMNQYVGLLELICSSSPIPTAEMLQDVSVLYATLAQKCTVHGPGEQEISVQHTALGYRSTLKGMVSDKKVFPTKDGWVSLAREPIIPDSKELEKVFKHHNICLLSLPPPEKKATHRSKSGNNVLREAEPSFKESDRALFLEICGIRPLSKCVKSDPQTESLRPCPSMQAMVRHLVPYIQRFLYHHDELSEVYSELVQNNIREKIKRLSFAQVGKLYLRYELDVSGGPLVEVQDVNCLLKDEKELYIQKDHLTARLDICRELVKLFCKESSHRKELMPFLSGLITSLDDSGSLKQFLLKEDIGELPGEEEAWEVPEPPRDNHPERVPSRSYSFSHAPEETPHQAPEDGEESLRCWPPRAPVHSTGASHPGHRDTSAVDAVMKMWPPPPGPDNRQPGSGSAQTGTSESPNSSGAFEPNQPQRSCGPTDRPSPHGLRPAPPNTTARVPNTPQTPEPRRQTEASTSRAEAGEENPPKAPSAEPTEPAGAQPEPTSLVVPEVTVASSTFQGSAAPSQPLAPLNMDFPEWSSHATMEELSPTCQIPDTVTLPGDHTDLELIGKWGEQLVNSFLCQWRDSGDARRPAHVLWCNQSGESGRPFDFKLTFEPAGGGAEEVYVEVKSTVKKEKSLVHMSANELDFALKQKQRYHIFRVYNAGDAQNVRLCRFQNLAQHLHTKTIPLYLFL